MAMRDSTGQPPYQNKVLDESGFLSPAWMSFFRWIYSVLLPLGSEKAFNLANNVSTPTNIDGLQFDFNKVNFALVNYFIQRISIGAGSTELIEGGTLRIAYKPKAKTWSIAKVNNGPDASGITFSITAGGQAQYVSSNMTGSFGTGSVSKLSYRVQTLSAKYVVPEGGF